MTAGRWQRRRKEEIKSPVAIMIGLQVTVKADPIMMDIQAIFKDDRYSYKQRRM
jgi:hypothetical protein